MSITGFGPLSVTGYELGRQESTRKTSDIVSSVELFDGQIFSWKTGGEMVSPDELDRRIALLSRNPPKKLGNSQSIREIIGELCWIWPLWGSVEISKERDQENRAVILFFEVVAQQFSPMRMLLNERYGKFNRQELDPQSAELIANEMKFFFRRVVYLPSGGQGRDEGIGSINELNFSGFSLVILPNEVGLFENLRSLKLANCGLTKLPSSIGTLRHLSDLDVSGNHLTELPETIINCLEVRNLNLTGNRLAPSILLALSKAFLSRGNLFVAAQVASCGIDPVQMGASSSLVREGRGEVASEMAQRILAAQRRSSALANIEQLSLRAKL